MSNTIKTIYGSRDYIKMSDRKKLIKSIIECNDEKLVDCYEYFNGMFTAISISKHHIVWSYDFDFNTDNVEYDLYIMHRDNKQ